LQTTNEHICRSLNLRNVASVQRSGDAIPARDLAPSLVSSGRCSTGAPSLSTALTPEATVLCFADDASTFTFAENC
jgi:hypothetical protein